MANTATKSAPKSTQDKTDKATAQVTASDTPQHEGQEQATTAENATAATDGDGAAATTGQEQPATTLHSLDELATLYRVPSWQQAALARMQGWEPGKRVAAETYEAALTALGARPQGGR